MHPLAERSKLLANKSSSPVQSRRLSPTVLAAALLTLAVTLAYSNSFTGPLILDDVIAVENNHTIRQLWPVHLLLPPMYRSSIVDGRPILNYSFALNYAFGGLKVGGYHAVNLAIHLCASLALLGVLRRTLLSPRCGNGSGTEHSPWLSPSHSFGQSIPCKRSQ